MLPALAPVKTVAEIDDPAARANTKPRNNNARGEAEPEASDSLPVPEQVADYGYASASTPPLQGNLFCGARLLKSDSYPVIYSSIREIGFVDLDGSPLIHKLRDWIARTTTLPHESLRYTRKGFTKGHKWGSSWG
ncbi:hypothetical protein DFH09DRAFT_1108325 [Mycena vulgaris]|nr:hypothetical protein DFH09DRAFT_1108325 [Mycena vulgaris]